MSLDELIFRLRHSDRSAFDEVYTAHYAALVNYATLMVSRESAEDIVHDVFLRLWNNRENLVADTGCGNVRAYLYRSVYNACVGIIRRRLSKLNHENWLNRELDS
ncbi:MAG: RNA polymerase sigma factor, partial [Candidatus Cryptobacteroides sp.]